MQLRQGPWWPAEEQADGILADDRRAGSTAIRDRQDWYSPDQLEKRQSVEISYERVADATPGLFVRAYNPLARTRPRSRPHLASEDTLDFDGRLPSLSPTPVGWTGDQWFGRSLWWADYGDWHLTTGQRCRIRRMYRQVGPGRAREALKDVLSQKYGVPPWVISRVAIRTRTCHT